MKSSLVSTPSNSRHSMPFPIEKRKLRIAHVQLLPLLSGVQRVSLEILRRIPRDQAEIFLICQQAGPLSEAVQKLGGTCIFIPELCRKISSYDDFRCFLRLSRIMHQERFDVVHTNSSKPGVIGRLAARWAGVPRIIHTVHGYAFSSATSFGKRWIYESAEKVAALAGNHVICLNRSDLKISLTRLGIARKKVRYIPNGVDLEKYRPVAPAERLRHKRRLPAANDERVCIAMIGRLWEQKNPLDLVRATSIAVHRGLRNFGIYLVGDGELAESVRLLVSDLELSEYVHLLGWRDDIDELLKGMDAVVLPSLWEGMPLALLEAAAAGLPCIATDIPGNRDVIINGETGVLVPCHDTMALAISIEQLVNSPDLRRRWGKAARKHAEAMFDLELRCMEIHTLYGLRRFSIT